MSYKELALEYDKKNNLGLFHSPVVPPDLSQARNLMHYCTYASNPYQAGLQPSEYTGWRDEEVAWHKTCYIHTGLNPTPTYKFKGPDAMKLMNKYFANSFKNFPIGSAKHGIMCDENGYDMIDGLLLRMSEDEYLTYWLSPWVQYCVLTSGMDVVGEDLTEKVFMFQLGGPTSLQVLEAASGDNLHDIKFICHRPTKIAGREVLILRVGMAGSLAYEVHGKIEDSIPVFEQIMKAGEKYGIRRLGVTGYNMTHWENGFPQAYIDFLFPWFENEGFAAFLKQAGLVASDLISNDSLSGSMGQDIKLRYRNPIELGWGKTINFDHDFLGKEALEKIAAGPHRVIVTLEWNKEDILDIHRSQLAPDEEPYADISHPDDFSWGRPTYHADQVLNQDGKCVGISTGRMIAWFYREMISICSIDQEYSALGTDVFVLWGEPGTRQKKIRAKVARWPYFDVNRNQKVDVSKIPVGTMD